jgi:MscS family membrane protein
MRYKEMIRKAGRYARFALLLAIVLLVACRGDSQQETVTPTATSTSGTASTPQATESVETTSEAAASTETDESEIIVTPTLAPTPTPGRIDNIVAEVVEGTVVEDFTFLGLSTEDWINLFISLAVVLLGYVVAGWLVGVALRWLVRRAGLEIADVFLKKIENQLRWIIVVILAAFATFGLDFLSEGALRLARGIYFSLVLWIAVIIVWELISYTIQLYEDKITENHGDAAVESMLPLLKKVAHVTLLIVALIIWLDNFGVNVTALIAALGIAGLALSLAAQDTLADAISGVVILLDQPFRIGDQIEVEELGTYADVLEVGTRTTRLRTTDNRLVVMPNSVISKNQIVNYTFPDPSYRIQHYVGVAYGTDLEKVFPIIIKTVRGIDGVMPDKPVDARYNEMGDSTMIIRVRWWVESVGDNQNTVGAANEALQEALDATGVEMPFPTQTMNLEIGEKTAERLSQSMTDRPGGDPENK